MSLYRQEKYSTKKGKKILRRGKTDKIKETEGKSFTDEKIRSTREAEQGHRKWKRKEEKQSKLKQTKIAAALKEMTNLELKSLKN